MEVIIVIDIGTSSIKIAAINLKGDLAKKFQGTYKTYRLGSNYLEQDPEVWWSLIKSGIYQMFKGHQSSNSPYSIIGIACCGHSPTMVFVDNKGSLLRPAIIWQDNRAVKEAEQIKEQLNQNDYESIMISTLNPASRIAKLLWLKNNEPDMMKNLYRLLEPKDYINFKLTGKYNTSILSGRGFLDINSGKIYTRFLNHLGIPESIIPKAVSSHSVIGATSKSLENEIGLPEGTPVIAGEMDSITSIIGTGINKKNMVYDISGTSEIVGILISRETISSQKRNLSNFTYPFYNHLRLLFGATQSSGKSINWFIENFAGKNKNPGKIPVKNKMNSLAKKNPLLFLPYMEGERSPVWDPNARGLFFGLSHQQTKYDLYQAILEGIGFSIYHNFENLQHSSSQNDILFESLYISGGGAKNNELNQIKADILGKKVVTTKVTESGLLGGAILTALGLGIFNFNTAIKNMVHINKTFYPDMEKHDQYYLPLYEIYQELYYANQKLFVKLNKI